MNVAYIPPVIDILRMGICSPSASCPAADRALISHMRDVIAQPLSVGSRHRGVARLTSNRLTVQRAGAGRVVSAFRGCTVAANHIIRRDPKPLQGRYIGGCPEIEPPGNRTRVNPDGLNYAVFCAACLRACSACQNASNASDTRFSCASCLASSAVFKTRNHQPAPYL